MIIVTALRTHASATKTEELVAGRVGMEAVFHFSSEWDGLGKTAVFEAGGVAKDVFISGDPCIVPHECMIEGAELRVGIYGTNADSSTVIPTVYAFIGTIKAGADPSGDESYPPTPDIGQQVIAIATEAKNSAENAVRTAEEALRSADESKVAALTAQASAKNAETDAEEARASAASAAESAASANAAAQVAIEVERRADEGEFNGSDGYTPQRGIDYWTDEDKREIINEVNDEAGDVSDRVDALEVNMESVLQDIADLKYVPISISSFSVNPGSAEMGDVVQSVNLTYGINKKPAALYLDGVEKTNPTSGGGFQLNNLSLTADKTWTLKAVDERNKEVTKQATLKFYNNVYYGVAGHTMPAIANLTAVLTDTRKRTVTVNAAAGEYIWYFVPVRLGACTFTVGGFDGGFELVATQDVTNGSGYTESFHIYRSSNAGLGSTTVEVK